MQKLFSVFLLFEWRLGNGEFLAREFLDISDHGPLLLRAESQCHTAVAGPTCAANAVDIGLGHIRQVVVDHHLQVGNVDATGCNVGGYDDACLPRLEVGESPLAGILRLVAVNGLTLDVAGLELAGYAVGPMLGT